MFKYIFKAFFCLSLLLIASCKNTLVPFENIKGETMGTFYNIKYQSNGHTHLQKSIDSILVLFNNSLSTYIKESTISTFNSSDSVYCFSPKDDIYFKPVFEKSKDIYVLTEGFFNPSIAPLVNYYGFGYSEKKTIKEKDTTIIMDLLQLLRFEEITLTEDKATICLRKPAPKVALDFSAIAKGYGVDIIAEFLKDKGIKNFMVEIGGEISTLGVNDKGQQWVIGINRPDEKSSMTAIEIPLQVSNKSVATSGNYRNSYESTGQKFAHIINPKTGLSYQTDILSTTVIADDCMSADALATAFMVMGLEKSLQLANNIKNVDAFFIFDLEGDGQLEYRATNNFSKYYLDNEQK